MPVELEKKQKDKLVKGIILNGIGILFFIAVIFIYILPTRGVISEKKSAAISAQTAFQNIEKNGVSATEYVRIAGINQKGALSKNEISEINTALKKTGKQDKYIDWLNEELNNKSIYDAEIEKNNRIVTDIIPTYSDIVTNTNDILERNRITLTDLITFVEEDLLISHNLESNSPIGFGNIVFTSSENVSSSIGTYTLNLDVTGRNKNIKTFIDTIQKSGNLVIKDGKIESPTLDSLNRDTNSKKFANLLINLKTISLPKLLDEKPNDESTVSMTLLMYVRAQNLSDLIGLRDELMKKSDVLKKNLDTYSVKCDNPGAPHCTKETFYRAVQTLKANYKEVSEVAKKISDTKKIAANANVNLQAEFDTVIKLYSDLSAAEGLVTGAINVIETTIKSETQSKN